MTKIGIEKGEIKLRVAAMGDLDAQQHSCQVISLVDSRRTGAMNNCERMFLVCVSRGGGMVGFTAILHSRGQNPMDNPHVHRVVPDGAPCRRIAGSEFGAGRNLWLSRN
jgi:hypothetical protein